MVKRERMTYIKRNGILPFQLKPNFLLQSHPFFLASSQSKRKRHLSYQ